MIAAEHGVEHLVLPFALTPEMVAWLHERVSLAAARDRRLAVLVEALLGDRGRGIRYQRGDTGTAEEVFYQGKANCLAFTNLFVGMAREVGVEVYFLSVQDIEEYTKEGDLVVISDHIAVGYGPAHDMTIIDFAVEQGTKYRKIRPITDLTAIALFYSNRGAEYLRRGEAPMARGWLEDAVRIDPQLAVAWINLGVARRRDGHLELADQAYHRALELDPEALSAYHNLAALLRIRGRPQEAAELMTLTDRDSNHNPFSFLALGDLSLRHGRLDEAERFYRRAVRLRHEYAEPYAAMGLLELQGGDLEEARRWLRKARKLDSEEPRVLLLAQRLGEPGGESVTHP